MALRIRSGWVWTAWFIAIAVSFGVCEALAIADPEGLTLSQFIANIGYRWLPFIALSNIGVGVLISHFWWPWVPKQLRATCGECGETILLKRPVG